MDRATLAGLLGGIGFFLAGLAAMWRASKMRRNGNNNHHR